MKNLYFLGIMLLLTTLSYVKDLPLDLNKTISIENNDSSNFCLAISEKNLKYCSKIKNKDEKSACFGILQRNSGYCTMIEDEDMKNSCLSIALSDIKYCEKIKDEEMKESCTAFYVENESDKSSETCIE